MKKNNQILSTKIIWCIVLLTITISLINAFSIARFSSSTQSFINIDLAVPIIELDNSIVELNNLDSNEQEINFCVKNFKYNDLNEIICSDVAFNYTIKFETINGTPVNYTLYKLENNERIEVMLSQDNVTGINFLPHTEQTTEQYILCVSLNDASYSNVDEQMKIIIDAEQYI